MIARYQHQSKAAFFLAMLLFLAGVLAANVVMRSVGLVLVGLSAVAYIFGCHAYARAKGQHWLKGAFAGLTVIGLVVLILDPDNSSSGSRADY